MIHVYQGNGKGKTTAAMGLALRAAAQGFDVVIVQFLKSGESGEARLLAKLPNVSVRAGKGSAKFTFAMDEADRAAARAAHDANLRAALEECAACAAGESEGLLVVLDEALDALAKGLLDEGLVREALAFAEGGAEVVLTGRAAPAFIAEAADYLTDMVCVRHPYQNGTAARKGVEF